MNLRILCVLITVLFSISIAMDENEKKVGDQLANKIKDIVKAGGGYGYVFDNHSYRILYGGKRIRVTPSREVLRDRRRTRQSPRRRKSSHHEDNTSITSDQIS